jgi:hypothetical protein
MLVSMCLSSTRICALVGAAACSAVIAATGCSSVPLPPDLGEDPAVAQLRARVVQHALDRDQITSLEREVERLRFNLAQAEATMRASKSERKAARTRATAVSVLADASISAEKAGGVAKWQLETLEEARLLLAEAESQLKAGHAQEAIYFASRGQRIALSVIDQAKLVEESADTRFVHVDKLNVRSGPSAREPVIVTLGRGTPVFQERSFGKWARVLTLRGERGWIHSSLLEPQ